MNHYLVDTKTGEIVLRARGPIKAKAGQKILSSEEDIPAKLAKYDEKSDSIVRITASSAASKKRALRRNRAEIDKRIEGESEVFKKSWESLKDEDLKSLLRQMFSLPRGVVVGIIGSDGED